MTGIIINNIKCDNCSAEYEIKHDLPEDDFTITFCPFCGHEREVEEDEPYQNIDERYDDWD
jgi:transcription elongation factor Elf1|tara:strand:- start:494 stop:676 length:183 start_codon:yes stop_codon:yes gene_type:complete